MPTPKEKDQQVDVSIEEKTPQEKEVVKPVETPTKKAEPEKIEKPSIDIEEILSKQAKDFEDKLKAVQEKTDKVEQENKTLQKIIDSLKDGAKTEDILKEIADSKEQTRLAREKSDLIKQAELAKEAEKLAKAEAERIKAEYEEKERISKLETEKAKFKAELMEIKNEKPWIADKIDKVLEEEDYEIQKNDFRYLQKFFDTSEEQEKYNNKLKAGKSAFDGVVSSNKDKDGKSGVVKFNSDYVNRIIGKK